MTQTIFPWSTNVLNYSQISQLLRLVTQDYGNKRVINRSADDGTLICRSV